MTVQNMSERPESGLLVLVRYKLKEGSIGDFLEELYCGGIIEASQAEDGCLRYQLARPLDDDDALVLTELWRDADAQQAHGLTAHYAALGELKAKYVTAVEIEKFDIVPRV